LAVNGFGGDGIAVTGGSAHLIVGNYVRTNATGTAALGNDDDGIDLKNSPNNIVGGGTAVIAT